jgi:adenine deaminase
MKMAISTLSPESDKHGFSPIETIKMMTINPADYYSIRYLGAIALSDMPICFFEQPGGHFHRKGHGQRGNCMRSGKSSVKSTSQIS